MKQRAIEDIPQTAGEKAELELRSHFEGRRHGQRLNVGLQVDLICVQRNLSARTVNLSNSGALLEITDDDAQGGMPELVAFCDEVGRLFAAGGTLDFQCGVTRTIDVIRITAGGLGKQMVPLMACRFKDPLSAEDFSRIGLTAPREDDAADADDDPADATPIVPDPSSEAAAARRVPAIQELLRWAVDLQATDIHIKAGSPPRLRVDGALSAVGEERLTDDEARAMVRNFLSAEEWETFDRKGDLDTAFALEDVARFRINVLRSRGRVGMILRRIPEDVPTIEELGLSPVCLKLGERKRGLVLVTGGSGSGKSTTLAAILRHVNETRPCHIVTLEDPIEFVHEEREAQITQREIGADTEDFTSALKRVLRQDPDVIMVGEMRDLETIKLAVTAAETGHLVFATLHTTSASQTVDRIVDVFPGEQQRQIRVQLAATLQAVVSQVLVPRIEGGVAVAQEILVINDAVRALIRDAKSPQLLNVMQTGANDGMQTLEDSLNELVRDETITRETALEYANAPGRVVAAPLGSAAPAPMEHEVAEEPTEAPTAAWSPEPMPRRHLPRRPRRP